MAYYKSGKTYITGNDLKYNFEFDFGYDDALTGLCVLDSFRSDGKKLISVIWGLYSDRTESTSFMIKTIRTIVSTGASTIMKNTTTNNPMGFCSYVNNDLIVYNAANYNQISSYYFDSSLYYYLSSELPIFTSDADVINYFKTGDISNALNKDQLEPVEEDPIPEPPEFDWTKSMQQTFEFYKVDPISWKDVARINNVKSCTISRDYSAETLGSANIDGVDDLGECYIRVYLITIQNGVTKKHPLGTFLVQTPSSKFDGKVTQTSLDAYTPLLELKENPPPIGYYIPKKTNVMEIACQLARDHARVPIVETECDIKLSHDFVADTNDTWLSLLSDLIANAKYVFDLDELSRIIFSPKQDTASLRPVWTYDDGNSSILYPELNNDYDLYGVPNVVEVVYSDTTGMFYSKAVNDDPNSPTSIVNRGREITKRITNPDIVGSPSQKQLDEYANNLLRAYSSMECTITYSHGYCPVRPGDCVMLNYEKAGLNNVKAKVISQSIECKPGCKVTETAVYTRKVWG